MTAALEGGDWSAARPGPHFTPGKDPVPILQEAWWAPGLVWTGGKSRPHQDSNPYRPYHSQSLYRLSYRAYIHLEEVRKFTTVINQDILYLLQDSSQVYSECNPEVVPREPACYVTYFSRSWWYKSSQPVAFIQSMTYLFKVSVTECIVPNTVEEFPFMFHP